MHVAKHSSSYSTFTKLSKWYLNCALSHIIHILEQIIQQKTHKSGSSCLFQVLQLCSEVVILTGGRWRVFIGVHRALGAGRGGAAHSPQLGRESPPPATGPTNRPQQTHQLRCLTPIKRSLAVAAWITLLAHGGQHLANVGRQQVIHFVALLCGKQGKNIYKSFI